jgi:GAF domain-containing protein
MNNQPVIAEVMAETGHPAVVAPIRLQDQLIGMIQLHELESHRRWNERELALIQAVADQAAQLAENIRLFGETQERASREQLITQITDRLRRAPDIDTLMETAVGELSRVLGPARTFVRFGSEADLVVSDTDPDNGLESNL